MVTRSEDVSRRDFCVQNGIGLCHFKDLSDKETMMNHVRVFAHVTVDPGNSMGHHVHLNEMEIYYILKGQGLFTDNGTETIVRAGDVCTTPHGYSHSIVNNTDEPLELLALVVLE